nr:hypothetical protein [Streptococcus suis]
MGVVILFLYGIGDLEKTEERRIQSKNLEQMFQKNSDAYAWIRVEGTKINYPVLQHPTDDTYYLTHDAEGNETQYGAIFYHLSSSSRYLTKNILCLVIQIRKLFYF